MPDLHLLQTLLLHTEHNVSEQAIKYKIYCEVKINKKISKWVYNSNLNNSNIFRKWWKKEKIFIYMLIKEGKRI